jgi:hypothetical protein
VLRRAGTLADTPGCSQPLCARSFEVAKLANTLGRMGQFREGMLVARADATSEASSPSFPSRGHRITTALTSSKLCDDTTLLAGFPQQLGVWKRQPEKAKLAQSADHRLQEQKRNLRRV